MRQPTTPLDLELLKELLMSPPLQALSTFAGGLAVHLTFEFLGAGDTFDTCWTYLKPTEVLKDIATAYAEERTLFAVELGLLRTHPNGSREWLESAWMSGEDWRVFAEIADAGVLHRECTESGHIDFKRAMELAVNGREVRVSTLLLA
jgi:hypothetical protein